MQDREKEAKTHWVNKHKVSPVESLRGLLVEVLINLITLNPIIVAELHVP